MEIQRDPTQPPFVHRPATGPEVANRNQTIAAPVVTQNNRDLVEAYAFGIPLGWMGAHHFYLGRPAWGSLYLFTFGLFGIGYIVDLVRMSPLVNHANKELRQPGESQKCLVEAYLLWFPLGLFGAHHFYLKQWVWAVVYLFSCGLFGLGWVMDGIWMKLMVKDYNRKLITDRALSLALALFPPPDNATPAIEEKDKDLATAYRLCLFPVTGLFGGHHYYMGRIEFGVFCTVTLSGFGLAWIVDCFRLPVLLKDANQRIRKGEGFRERRLDDCYLVAFPAGLFGAHHFYLRNIGRGVLYFFTAGNLVFGWIIDLFRMKKLVEVHKEKISEPVPVTAVGADSLSPVIGQDGQLHYITVSPPGNTMPRNENVDILRTYAIASAPPSTEIPGPMAPSLPDTQTPTSYR